MFPFIVCDFYTIELVSIAVTKDHQNDEMVAHRAQWRVWQFSGETFHLRPRRSQPTDAQIQTKSTGQDEASNTHW